MSEAIVFDIQRFSIHDGPGIRTVVFFKGCALACVWCQNPEGRRRSPQLSYHTDRCIPGCKLCLPTCPVDALVDDIEGRVLWGRCTDCGACAQVCPADALVMVGQSRTPRQLLDEVLADREFFEATGGGLTLSGGEPLLHHEFLAEFLPLAKEAGLHVVLETGGQFDFELLEPLFPHIDLILFDVKAGGSLLHRSLTGSGNERILANLRRLTARDPDPRVEVRMPVIPGYNDGEDSLTKIAASLDELGVHELTLLPYNPLWEPKLGYIDTEQQPLGLVPPPGHVERVARELRARGIDAEGLG